MIKTNYFDLINHSFFDESEGKELINSNSLKVRREIWQRYLMMSNTNILCNQNFVPVDNFNTNNKNDSPNKLIITKKSR